MFNLGKRKRRTSTPAQRAYPSSYKRARYTRMVNRGMIRNQRAVMYRTPGALGVTETKYFDSHRTAGAVSSVWTMRDPTTLNTLFAPQQGTGLSNRIGNRVIVKKIRLKGYIQWAVNSTANTSCGDFCRVMIVKDMQSNGAQFTPGNVVAGVTGDQDLWFQNTASFGRFQVLKDFTIRRPSVSLGGTTGFSAEDSWVPWKKNINLNDTVKFNGGNAGTIGDVVDNSYHILCVSANNALNTLVNLDYNCRVVFNDP